MMSLDKAKELNIKPLARVVSTANAAVDAKIMGMGVVPSVRRALYFANLKVEDIDYWELNEAFAAQIIGCNRELKIPLDKMNINGVGISLGHPVGMTGARLPSLWYMRCTVVVLGKEVRLYAVVVAPLRR